MDRVVLDTDVSSLSLKHRLPPQVLVRLIGKQPCVTFVTVGELTQWAELRQWGRRNRDTVGQLDEKCGQESVQVGDHDDFPG